MRFTPNLKIPTDTLGYYTFKRSYRQAIGIVNQQLGLSLQVVTVGKVLFQENVKANLKAIAVALTFSLPAVETLSVVQLKASYLKVMAQVDAQSAGGGPLAPFTYQPETESLVAAMSVAPTIRRKKTIDGAIKALKDGGVWAKLIRMHKVGHDRQSSLLNWKNPTQSAVVVGSPAFVANTHFAGGAGAYVRTGVYTDELNPSDVYIGAYSNSATTNQTIMGGANASANGYLILPKNTGSGTMSARLASAAVTTFGVAADWTGGGWTAAGRGDLTNIQPYRGPVNKGATAAPGAAIPEHIELYVCGYNANGTLSTSTNPVGGWVIAQNLTDAQAKILANVMQELQSAFQDGELDTYPAGTLPSAPVYDAIVYGATSMGAIAAYELKRQGKNVAIVGGYRDRDIGAMSTTGLGFTDLDNQASIGGLPLYLMRRIQALQGTNQNIFPFNPRWSRAALRAMLDPSKTGGLDIPIYWSDGINAVSKTGTKVNSITTVDGRTFAAPYFIDATFEGDLIYRAGLSVNKGREAAGSGFEATGGFRGLATTQAGNNHQFKNHAGTLVRVDPWITPNTPASGLLPNIAGIMGTDTPAVGSADQRVQAFNFRLTLTTNRAFLVPFPTTPPPGYSPLTYEALGRLFALDPTIVFSDIFIQNSVDSGFFDYNAKGGFSLDLWGGSTGYVEATYAEREVIWKRHWNFILGLFYYLQYEADARIPAAVRNSANSVGFSSLHYTRPHPNDDYNWNPSLYVREGYRLVSDQVFDANYLAQTDGTTPSSIKTVGTASYAFDSHGTMAWADNSTGQWRIWIEGNFEDQGQGGANNIAPLPYEAYVPKAAECENIATCFTGSYTHAAFGATRMEFSSMAVAQSMACAIAIALETGNPALQSINYPNLRSRILATPSLAGEVAPVLPQVN